MVAEDGRTLYVQNRNANLSSAHEWVTKHVVPCLIHQGCKPRGKLHGIGRDNAHCRKQDCPWLWADEMKHALFGFTAYTTPEFWGYVCAYDWVAICQLFGTMMELPERWPMYCNDLRQWLTHNELAHITQPDDMPHHALSDAQWVMTQVKHYVLGTAHGRQAGQIRRGEEA